MIILLEFFKTSLMTLPKEVKKLKNKNKKNKFLGTKLNISKFKKPIIK